MLAKLLLLSILIRTYKVLLSPISQLRTPRTSDIVPGVTQMVNGGLGSNLGKLGLEPVRKKVLYRAGISNCLEQLHHLA